MSAREPTQRELRQAIRDAEELARAVTRACEKAQAMLEHAVQGPFEDGFECDAEPSDHRRQHRPGRPAKIDADHELRAFIEARLDKLTFVEIAADVASRFPPTRRVGKSAIHAWWARNIRKR